MLSLQSVSERSDSFFIVLLLFYYPLTVGSVWCSHQKTIKQKEDNVARSISLLSFKDLTNSTSNRSLNFWEYSQTLAFTGGSVSRLWCVDCYGIQVLTNSLRICCSYLKWKVFISALTVNTVFICEIILANISQCSKHQSYLFALCFVRW